MSPSISSTRPPVGARASISPSLSTFILPGANYTCNACSLLFAVFANAIRVFGHVRIRSIYLWQGVGGSEFLMGCVVITDSLKKLKFELKVELKVESHV